MYKTIQQGIQAAEMSGAHSIILSPGTYTGDSMLGSIDDGLAISATSSGVILTGSINIAGASNISLQGLTFSGDGSTVAVTALNSSNISISANTFANTSEAVVLDGTKDSAVSDNFMTDTVNSAIEEKNGADSNTISGNIIHDVSTANTVGAIWLHGSSEGTISSNEITNTTGAGISLTDFYGPGTTATQNNNNVVEYNSLSQVDTQSADSGAIYILGRSQDPNTGNVVKMNFIGATGSSQAQAVAIYLDDNASGVTVTQNIIQGTSTLSHGFEIHGGSNNLFDGNIFDLGPGEPGNLPVYGLLQVDNPDQSPQGSFVSLANDKIIGNIFTTESPAPRDPAFADWTNGTGSVSISGNDYYAFTGATQYVRGTGGSGDTNPAFVAPAAQVAQSLADYATWSGAGINFQPIKTSLIA